VRARGPGFTRRQPRTRDLLKLQGEEYVIRRLNTTGSWTANILILDVNWLKDYSYLATWLSFVLAFLVAVWQTKGALKLSDINWTWLVIYVTFVVSFGIGVSPVFDKTARNVADLFAGACFSAIILGSQHRRPPSA
jgi:hypothetical protein